MCSWVSLSPGQCLGVQVTTVLLFPSASSCFRTRAVQVDLGFLNSYLLPKSLKNYTQRLKKGEALGVLCFNFSPKGCLPLILFFHFFLWLISSKAFSNIFPLAEWGSLIVGNKVSFLIRSGWFDATI